MELSQMISPVIAGITPVIPSIIFITRAPLHSSSSKCEIATKSSLIVGQSDACAGGLFLGCPCLEEN